MYTEIAGTALLANIERQKVVRSTHGKLLAEDQQNRNLMEFAPFVGENTLMHSGKTGN